MVLYRDTERIFYHGTSREAWKAIQEEGVLWGVTGSYRYTYLTPHLRIAEGYGPIILGVQYRPGDLKDNHIATLQPGFKMDYSKSCWQFSVFDPIPVDRILIVHEVSYE